MIDQTPENNPKVQKESFAAGEYIFFEGDIERHFYIVEAGLVNISTRDRLGKQVSLVNIHEGESFGEFAMISNSPRSATAQAVTDVSLVKVSEEGFTELLTELPAWAESMMKYYVERLKEFKVRVKLLESEINRG